MPEEEKQNLAEILTTLCVRKAHDGGTCPAEGGDNCPFPEKLCADITQDDWINWICKVRKNAFEAGFRKGFVFGSKYGVKILAMIFRVNSKRSNHFSPHDSELLKFCSDSCLDNAPIVDKLTKRLLDECREDIYNLIR